MSHRRGVLLFLGLAFAASAIPACLGDALDVPGGASTFDLGGSDLPFTTDLPFAVDLAHQDAFPGFDLPLATFDLHPTDLAHHDLAHDFSQATDLAEPVDFAHAIDFASPVDLSVPPDLASPVDLAVPPDLATPLDLTPPPDLASPPDLSTCAADGSWTVNQLSAFSFGCPFPIDCGHDALPACTNSGPATAVTGLGTIDWNVTTPAGSGDFVGTFDGSHFSTTNAAISGTFVGDITASCHMTGVIHFSVFTCSATINVDGDKD